MCKTSQRRFPFGLAGLGFIILTAVIVLLFGRTPNNVKQPDDRPSATTNLVKAVTATADTNDLTRTCTTNTVPTATAVQPTPQPVPVTTNAAPNAATHAVAKKAPVRRIVDDPNVPKNRQVLLANRRIAVASGRQFPKKFCTSQTPTARKTAPYVLISENPVNRAVHSQAMSNGARVAGFLPHNALLVEVDEETLKNLSEDPAFIAAVEYEPLDKIQPQLLTATDETFETTVMLMNAGYLDAMRDYVSQHGGRITDGSIAKNGKSFGALLPRKLVTALAAKGEIRWIERRTR